MAIFPIIIFGSTFGGLVWEATRPDGPRAIPIYVLFIGMILTAIWAGGVIEG